MYSEGAGGWRFGSGNTSDSATCPSQPPANLKFSDILGIRGTYERTWGIWPYLIHCTSNFSVTSFQPCLPDTKGVLVAFAEFMSFSQWLTRRLEAWGAWKDWVLRA
jgi:hypothetical protein